VDWSPISGMVVSGGEDCKYKVRSQFVVQSCVHGGGVSEDCRHEDFSMWGIFMVVSNYGGKNVWWSEVSHIVKECYVWLDVR